MLYPFCNNYINDLDENAQAIVSKSADDTKIENIMDNEDCQEL